MAQAPFPVSDVENVKQAMQNMQLSMDDLYQNRLGGAIAGDVFVTDAEDVLTLQVDTTKGIDKANSKIIAKVNEAHGMTVNSGGIAVKLKPSGNILVDSEGLYTSGSSSSGISFTTAAILGTL
jgi:hypothetical protein